MRYEISLETMSTRAFTIETPFHVAADPYAHSGKADVQAALARRPAAYPVVVLTSSRTGAGLPELRAAVARLLSERA